MDVKFQPKQVFDGEPPGAYEYTNVNTYIHSIGRPWPHNLVNGFKPTVVSYTTLKIEPRTIRLPYPQILPR